MPGLAGHGGAVTGRPGAPPALFVASYADEEYEFRDGERRRFGRDDDACEIVIWEELRRDSVSKVAGVLWCLDGELWVRNLSTAHELAVSGPKGPLQCLPPRAENELGAARSVPAPIAELSAPSTGTWTILIRQITGDASSPAVRRDAAAPLEQPAPTLRIGPVPQKYARVAYYVCAPVLYGGRPPATYDQVAGALNITKRQARRRVEELCAYYLTSYPGLLSGDPRSGEPVYAALARVLVNRGAVTKDTLLVVDESGQTT
jgi:hypothetical protein